MRYKVRTVAAIMIFLIGGIFPSIVCGATERNLSADEIDLIALVTMAEAEGESEYGKRLVIDTILNRMDSEYFPNTISEVIINQDSFRVCGTVGLADVM